MLALWSGLLEYQSKLPRKEDTYYAECEGPEPVYEWKIVDHILEQVDGATYEPDCKNSPHE